MLTYSLVAKRAQFCQLRMQFLFSLYFLICQFLIHCTQSWTLQMFVDFHYDDQRAQFKSVTFSIIREKIPRGQKSGTSADFCLYLLNALVKSNNFWHT